MGLRGHRCRIHRGLCIHRGLLVHRRLCIHRGLLRSRRLRIYRGLCRNGHCIAAIDTKTSFLFIGSTALRTIHTKPLLIHWDSPRPVGLSVDC